MDHVKIQIAGDTALSLIFGNEISPKINALVRAFDIALESAGIPGIVETVPAYCSLMIHYRPEIIRFQRLAEQLNLVLNGLDSVTVPPTSVIEIPVLYGGEAGPDLGAVAEHNKKSEQEVIEIHSAPEYLIYMLGFTPGFPYLGGMSREIATPRLAVPRVCVPGGSVGIAGEQTGVYPMDSPGGWQIIGHTPLKLYDPSREQPILIEAGQYVKFRPVGKAEYDRIRAEAEANAHQPRVYTKEVR